MECRAICCCLVLFAAQSAVLVALPSDAQILDEGQVVVNADPSLVVGIDGFGRRTNSGVDDGPYDSVTLGVERDGDGDISLSGGASLSTQTLTVAVEGRGILRVSDGSTLYSDEASLAATQFSDRGEVVVQGPGSRWENSGTILLDPTKIGLLSATITVEDGGVVETGDLVGPSGDIPSEWINVRGPGSRLDSAGVIDLGSDAAGPMLAVSDGGVVTAARSILGGGQPAIDNPTENFVVEGAGSLLRAGNTIRGNGEMIVRDGGRVESTSATLDHQSFSVNEIDGPGSAWVVSGPLVMGVGEGNSDGISVSNGGLLSTGDAEVGLGSGGAVVTVTGVGSRWTNRGRLQLGDGEDFLAARVTVGAGGVVTNTGATIECEDGRSGAFDCAVWVDGAGSVWQSTGSVFVGGDENGPTRRGSVRIINDGCRDGRWPGHCLGSGHRRT